MSNEEIATPLPVPAHVLVSNAVDEYGVPISIVHYRPKGMRHDVWDAVHALEEPIVRGSNKFTHICLLCTKQSSKWDNALCRISNTSNAMKHFRSRHQEWFAGREVQHDEQDINSAGEDVTTKPRATRAPIMKPKENGELKRLKVTTEQEPDAKRSKGLLSKPENKTEVYPIKTAVKTAPTNAATLSLVDKVVVITGASGGIGAAIARRMAQEGANVVIGARRAAALEQVSNEIVEAVGEEMKQRLLVRETDVTNRMEVHDLVIAAEETFGPVDILVNNAGVMPFELMRNVNQDSWDRTIDVNCKGVLNGIAAVLPQMLSRQKGHIVNISSDAGRKVFPGLGVYSASKMFVEAISQALRLENVGSGLRVTTIQPGNVATDLVAHGQNTSGGDTEAMKVYGAPSGYQVLQPQDVANAVVYAVAQPTYVAVNEILVEPRDEPI